MFTAAVKEDMAYRVRRRMEQPAAGNKPRPFGFSLVDVTENSVALPAVDQRTHGRRRIERVTGSLSVRRAGQRLDYTVVKGAVRED